MKIVISSLFVIVGIVNLLPVAGVVSEGAVQRLYQLGTLSHEVSFLLRHRAFLFSIVGFALIGAAFLPQYRIAAALAGAASMASYVILFFLLKPDNAGLAKVAWIDIAALALLAVAVTLEIRRYGDS